VNPGATPADVAAVLAHVTAGLPGHEDRPGQLRMAELVAEAIQSKKHLIVQAGTGTGKTLAYLVGAIVIGEKLVVATATKALQDQLATKDLPFLSARLAELERNKQQLVSIFKALADGSRLDILRLIMHHGDQMHGKRIANKLNLSASAVSRHLAQLKEAGLIVEETQDNRTFTYKIQENAISTLPDTLFDVLHH